MPRSHKIKTDVLARAMKDFDGDYAKVGEHFGVTAKHVRERIYHDPKLRAIWVENGTREVKPDGIELMERQHEYDDEKGSRLLEALDKNSRYIFNNELENMLSDPSNIQKLKIFEDFDDSVGLLMAEALRVTQKVNIRQNMSLFEVTEALRDDIIDPHNHMDTEEKMLKTRLFLQATEQQGKFYDRLLKGLDFQLKLVNESDKRETKKKPGFRPLNELKDAEEKLKDAEEKIKSSDPN